ncbi:MAG TPA: ATP-dependent RecD-like DNA helicase [Spirochaetia bacterium]|nr:ATP-dependent RecD-like DNA helicase [Spirochaetia bacterium]
MEEMSGYVERITYCNEENSYTVARVQEKGKRELTTVVGNLAGLNSGELLRATGKWVQNPKFGRQFQVETYQTLVPATVNGIEKYLASGLIKGIGPAMAKRIVQAFGPDTLEVIEKTPEKLSRVGGLGARRIADISRAWQEQRDIKDIMIFLQGHGVSAGYSAKIFRQYGADSVKTVQENPYRLAADIRGIGFVTADKIARNMGMDPASVTRVKEGVVYVLGEVLNEGHVYYPYLPLLDRAAGLLQVDREIVVEAVAGLFTDQRIVLEDLNKPEEEFQPNHKAVYLPAFHTAEAGLARRLTALAAGPSLVRPVDQGKAMAWVEERLKVSLAEKQKEAVTCAVQDKVTIITGGPGTGKTTIIKAMILMFQALQLRVLLAAPTGRAARRMQEAAGIEAKTIHRLLEYSPQKGGFKRNQDNPLAADVVIIDEASMIDTILMYYLVKAVPLPATLILVGDINQLPSVGPGTVFRDIIACGRFKVVTLTDIFRQAAESRIVVAAHQINEGKMPDLRAPVPPARTDFYFIEQEDPERAAETIVNLCRERIPKSFGFHATRDVQVLAPMHRGSAGVTRLNERLQEVLNSREPKVVKGRPFKVDDKVMQIVNNYDKDVYNGDIGLVASINPEDQELVVDFDGRLVSYGYNDTDQLEPAYAVSIHKSQGSEYPAVVIPVLMQHFMLLQRNLIYTGITRGKKLVVLVGAKKALATAIANDKPLGRYTLLRERLQ